MSRTSKNIRHLKGEKSIPAKIHANLRHRRNRLNAQVKALDGILSKPVRAEE